MTTINRPPRALQDLLQLQTKGRNPNELLETIQSTIDVFRLILSDIELESVQASGIVAAASAPNFFNTITVPAGELWYVVSVACTANSSAEVFDLTVGLQNVSATSSNAFLASKSKMTFNVYSISEVYSPDAGLLVPSGVTIGQFTQFASADITCATRILFYRLKF